MATVTLEAPQTSNPSWFTPDKAREMGRKALQTRLENAARIKEAAAIGEKLSEIVSAQADSSESFRMIVLARVRRQIERQLGMLEEAKEPTDVDKLTRSLDALGEYERKLSGRSLPPTIRPGKPSTRKPTPALPEPVQVSTEPVQPTLPTALPGVNASVEPGQDKPAQ